jgi:uncharacterized protein with NRDE domain
VARVCLLVVAWHVVPGTPLLIGANRDERFDRPTTAFTVLRQAQPRVLGGRDERAGGTWLAVNEHGVVAGLTNQPLGDARDPSRRSRGELPLALAGHRHAAAAVEALLEDHRPLEYNGSWLLVGDRHALIFVDFTGLVEPEPIMLPPGLHVLENRSLGAPSPKVDRVRAALSGLGGAATDPAAAVRLALSDHTAPEATDSPTGATCIHLDEFGTRSSCIVQVPEAAGTRPRILVADGPPCVTPFVDVSECWERPSPR